LRYRPRSGAGYQRVTLGTLPAVGLAEAREHANRLRVDVAAGADPQRQRMAERAAAANVPLTTWRSVTLMSTQYRAKRRGEMTKAT
jgi:hypothetical protein